VDNVDELQELETLLKEFMQAIQQAMQSGEILSDEFQGQVANTLSLLFDRIEQLRQEQEPVEGLQQPKQELEPGPYPSSNINAFRYDPKSQKLMVKFQDKYPGQNGPVYGYEGVPPFIFDVFRRGAVAPKTSGKNAWHRWKKGVTPSLGAAMHALVKAGGYPYQRLS
jgi:hypothetical protein